MKRSLSLALAVLVASAVVVGALEEVRVIEREARIRPDKRKFGDALLVVHEGEAVGVLSADPPWLRVQKGNVQGWLHESAITRDRNYVFSTASLVGTGVEASERTAGQKGFDAITEKSYRASEPQLRTAFVKVDAIDAAAPDERQVESFIAAGELAGAGR